LTVNHRPAAVPRIRPTVCTNREIAVISPCLRALAGSDVAEDTIVVLSGLTPALRRTRSEEIRGILAEATIVEAGNGLSVARNAALEAAVGNDVVYYIDDDAVIGDTWVDSVRTGWAEADHTIGALGGPIRPRFLAPRPGWMSELGVASLSILDLGDERRELDPLREALYGANLGIKVCHGRAVGGFDAALGPSGLTPGFGDDIDIQRRMAEHGLSVRYEPGAWVDHLISPERLTRRSQFERRLRTGMDYGRNPTRAAGVVGFEAMSAIGSGLVVRALGRRAESMDRWSYAAQCLGELRMRISRRVQPARDDPRAGE
jgi:glycosyltransferase involved in cell wall biosynthesis